MNGDQKLADTIAYLVAMQLQREVEGGKYRANYKKKKELQTIHPNISGREEIQLSKTSFKLGISLEVVGEKDALPEVDQIP